MKDLTPLHKKIAKAFEEEGIKDPAFVISFTEASTQWQQVFWVSNNSRMDSLKLLDFLAEKMRKQLN